MPKFFVDKNNIIGEMVTILNEDAIHIKKVLRLSPKDIIIVCDGQGTDYKCEIFDTGKNTVTAKVLQINLCPAEPNVQLTLFQALPKGSKMDMIIQKAVELGVHTVVPVVTKRAVVRLEGKAAEQAKVARWQRIALEAAKQCGRGIIPNVHLPVSFDESLKMLSDCDCAIMPYEKEASMALRDVLNKSHNIKTLGILIGPEGGFDPSEAELALQNSIKRVGLGSRILRTETAPLAVIAIVMYELEEI